MTADWIVVDDGSGNTLRVPMTTTVTIDKNVSQTSTEAFKRDEAGTTPVTAWYSKWISIWAIYNPATLTIAGLFSLSATAPTLPSGYTHKAWVGAVYNSSGGSFVVFSQRQNQVACAETTLGTSLTATGYNSFPTATSPAMAIPPSAVAVGGWAAVSATAPAAVNPSGYIYPTNTSTLGRAVFSFGVTTPINNGWVLASNWRVILATPQTLYYGVYGAGMAMDVYVDYWEY